MIKSLLKLISRTPVAILNVNELLSMTVLKQKLSSAPSGAVNVSF